MNNVSKTKNDLIGSDITINAKVINANDYTVLARTKSGYDLLVCINDINTIRPKITAGEDRRRGN